MRFEGELRGGRLWGHGETGRLESELRGGGRLWGHGETVRLESELRGGSSLGPR